MSDSHPARPIDIPLVGAQELQLTATDSGDGIACDMTNWVEARLDRDPRMPLFGQSVVTFGDRLAPARSAETGGFSLIAGEAGPQVTVMEAGRSWTVCLGKDEQVHWTIPIKTPSSRLRVMADVRLTRSGTAVVQASLSRECTEKVLHCGARRTILTTEPVDIKGSAALVLTTRSADEETAVRWSNLRYVLDGKEFPVALVCPPSNETIPPPVLPNMRAAIEEELIQWDWRMQNGIGTERESRTILVAERPLAWSPQQGLKRSGEIARADPVKVEPGDQFIEAFRLPQIWWQNLAGEARPLAFLVTAFVVDARLTHLHKTYVRLEGISSLSLCRMFQLKRRHRLIHARHPQLSVIPLRVSSSSASERAIGAFVDVGRPPSSVEFL